MANIVFNVAKGRVNELHDRVDGNDPAASVLVIGLLKAVEADSLLQDRTDWANILAQAANTEADFTDGGTPYARKILTDTDIVASVVDQTNNRREADIPDQVWDPAGGSTDNDLVKFLTGYDPNGAGGTDAEIVPLTAHDFVITTNGGSITAAIDSNGYFRAA